MPESKSDTKPQCMICQTELIPLDPYDYEYVQAEGGGKVVMRCPKCVINLLINIQPRDPNTK